MSSIDKKHQIKFLDYILLLNGNVLYKRGRVSIGLNYVFRVVFFILVYNQLYLRLKYLVSATKLTLLYDMSNLSNMMAIAITQHYIWFRRDEIRDLFETMVTNIRPLDQLRMKWLMMICMVLYVLSSLALIMALVPMAFSPNFKGGLTKSWIYSTRTTYIIALIIRLFIGNWMATSCSCYVTFYHLFYYMKQENLRLLNSKIRIQVPFRSSTEIVRMRNIQDLGIKFDQLFNVFPAIWLLSFLLQSTGYLVLFREISMHVQLIFSEWFILGIQMSLCLTTIAIVMYRESQNREEVGNLCKLIIASAGDNLNTNHSMLVNELEQPLVLTGCGQFEIKPSLLISFIGSVITFSVLFIQLTA